MPDRSAVLSLDLGTSELKVGLVAVDGSVLAVAGRAYGVEVDTASGRAEQDPELWWDAVRSAVGEVHAAVAETSIDAITVVGQGPTLVAADADGRPVRPAITWLDTRTVDDAAALEAATGIGGWSLGVTPAARLVERTEPSVAAATRWYLDSWDWIALRLSGVAARSRAEGQVDPEARAVESTGIPAARLPERIAAGARLGGLTDTAAAELGLVPGTPVVAGCVDAYASFFGAGLEAPGDAIDTGGTSGGFAVYWDRELDVPGTFAIAAPLPGRWLYGGAMTATGKALEWLGEDVLHESDTVQLVAEAAGVAPGADGLVFLPYLAGERSPIWDPAARGVFAGLSLAHRRGHLVRAVMEAAALALRHVAAPIRAAGIELTEMRVSGGTARSPLWNRIKADVLGVPVAVPATVDTAMIGAAVVASVGVGAFDGFGAAMRALVRFEERLAPDPATRATYDALFERYVALWPALRPVLTDAADAGSD